MVKYRVMANGDHFRVQVKPGWSPIWLWAVTYGYGGKWIKEFETRENALAYVEREQVSAKAEAKRRQKFYPIGSEIY